MEEFRKKDAAEGLKIAQVLEGFISRKVVKQTVMTVVYGVTRYGGRLQIEKRLKEIDEFPEVACPPQPPCSVCRGSAPAGRGPWTARPAGVAPALLSPCPPESQLAKGCAGLRPRSCRGGSGGEPAASARGRHGVRGICGWGCSPSFLGPWRHDSLSWCFGCQSRFVAVSLPLEAALSPAELSEARCCCAVTPLTQALPRGRRAEAAWGRGRFCPCCAPGDG